MARKHKFYGNKFVMGNGKARSGKRRSSLVIAFDKAIARQEARLARLRAFKKEMTHDVA